MPDPAPISPLLGVLAVNISQQHLSPASGPQLTGASQEDVWEVVLFPWDGGKTSLVWFLFQSSHGVWRGWTFPETASVLGFSSFTDFSQELSLNKHLSTSLCLRLCLQGT